MQPISSFVVSDPGCEGPVQLKRPVEAKDLPTIQAAAKRRAAKMARLQAQQQQQGADGGGLQQGQGGLDGQQHQQQQEEEDATAGNGAGVHSVQMCQQQQGQEQQQWQQGEVTAPGACKVSTSPVIAAAAAAADTAGQLKAHTVGSPAEGSHVQPQQECSTPAAAAVEADPWSLYRLAEKLLEDRADVIDVVTYDSIRCNCFTKSYSQYAKGTGSLLATVSREDMDPAWTLEQGAHLVHEPLISVGDAGEASKAAAAAEGGGGSSSNSREAAAAGSSSRGAEGEAAEANTTAAAAASSSGAGSGDADVSKEQGVNGGVSASGGSRCRPGSGAAPPAADELTALQQRLALAEEWKKLRLRYFTPRWVEKGGGGGQMGT